MNRRWQFGELQKFGLASYTRIVTVPFERVKSLLQVQDELVRTGRLSETYSGPIDCFQKIVQNEGLFGIWKGLTANLLQYFPRMASDFLLERTVNTVVHYLHFGRIRHGFFKWLFGTVTSGALVGSLSFAFVCPLDYCSFQLMIDTPDDDHPPKYNGIIDVLQQTTKKFGISGLYTGYYVSILGIVAYRTVYFTLYDILRRTYDPNRHSPTLLTAALMLISVTAGVASYPFESVRRRMIVTAGTSKEYKHALEVVRQTGTRPLFAGVHVHITRSLAASFANSLLVL